MNTPNQNFFPSINQYWWSSGTGNSRVVNLCDLFQVLQIVSKLSKWSWRGISSLWSSSALARKNVRHMLCRCLNWTLIQVRWYYEDTCMVAYWGGGGGTVARMWDFRLKCMGSNSGQILKCAAHAVVLQCDKWKLFFNWSYTCCSFPFLGQEKKLVEEVFNNAIDCLSDEDKTLPQVKLYVNKAALWWKFLLFARPCSS